MIQIRAKNHCKSFQKCYISGYCEPHGFADRYGAKGSRREKAGRTFLPGQKRFPKPLADRDVFVGCSLAETRTNRAGGRRCHRIHHRRTYFAVQLVTIK